MSGTSRYQMRSFSSQIAISEETGQMLCDMADQNWVEETMAALSPVRRLKMRFKSAYWKAKFKVWFFFWSRNYRRKRR